MLESHPRVNVALLIMGLAGIAYLGNWPAELGALGGALLPAFVLPRQRDIRPAAVAILVFGLVGAVLAQRVIRGPVSLVDISLALLVGLATAAVMLLCSAMLWLAAQHLPRCGPTRRTE